MAIRDNETGTIYSECADPGCDRVDLPTGTTLVRDTATGAFYCDALCHHSHHYGVRPPIDMIERAALNRARAWMRAHR